MKEYDFEIIDQTVAFIVNHWTDEGDYDEEFTTHAEALAFYLDRLSGAHDESWPEPTLTADVPGRFTAQWCNETFVYFMEPTQECVA